MTSRNGGTSKPSPLIQAIAVAHSPLPGCAVLLHTPVGGSDDHRRTYDTHHKACLVKVVQIAVEDAEVAARVGEQAEPAAQKIRILTKSPLVAVRSSSFRRTKREGHCFPTRRVPRDAKMQSAITLTSSSEGRNPLVFKSLIHWTTAVSSRAVKT